MKTLNEPVFEVKQDSEWYKNEVKFRAQIEEFIKEVYGKYGVQEGFVFNTRGGVYGAEKGSELFELLSDQLTKKEVNGSYLFRKNSRAFKELDRLFELTVQPPYPFKAHDELGLNNLVARHWINDRWFYQVRNEELVKGTDVVKVLYSDYLRSVVDYQESKEDK